MLVLRSLAAHCVVTPRLSPLRVAARGRQAFLLTRPLSMNLHSPSVHPAATPAPSEPPRSHPSGPTAALPSHRQIQPCPLREAALQMLSSHVHPTQAIPDHPHSNTYLSQPPPMLSSQLLPTFHQHLHSNPTLSPVTSRAPATSTKPPSCRCRPTTSTQTPTLRPTQTSTSGAAIECAGCATLPGPTCQRGKRAKLLRGQKLKRGSHFILCTGPMPTA